MSYYTKHDVFRWAIEIISGSNDTWVVSSSQEGGKISGAFDEAYYWQHKDAFLDAEYNSFALDFESQLKNKSNNASWEVNYETPKNGNWDSKENVGMKVSSSSEFSIDFSDSKFTAQPEWFGFPRDKTSNVESNTGEGDTEAKVLTSSVSVYGMWVPDKAAQNHRRKYQSIQEKSDGGNQAYAVTWDNHEIRRNKYINMASPFVYANRINITAERDKVVMGPNDENNAIEDMWLDANAPDGTGRGEIIVEYNDTVGDVPGVSQEVQGDWDIVRIEDGAQRKSWFSFVEDQADNDAGERYLVDFDTRILSQNYSH